MIREALKEVRKRAGVLVCSFGGLHWDLQLALALEFSISIELVLVKSDTIDRIIAAFGSEIATLIVNIRTLNSCGERDAYVLQRADVLFPVWVRPKGNIAAVLSDLVSPFIDMRFCCSEYRFKSKQKYDVDAPSDTIRNLPSNYLWHWTRSSQEKWPEEMQNDFCVDLMKSETYPRNAYATLIRILTMGRILASGKCIHQNVPVVSLTENHPSEMKKLFSWRNGRHRMNFEPYAVGFPKSSLKGIELVKVQYNQLPSWETLSKGDRWRSENEWRVRGDLVITEEMKEKMIVIVRCSSETIGGAYTILSYN